MSANPAAVTTFARPVRAPAATPAADSINVVVLDVPAIPAKAVVNVSTTNARSIFELKPLSSSNAFVSDLEKIPVWLPIPIKVPMASNNPVNPMAKIVTIASDA